jgi:hypothetical protein
LFQALRLFLYKFGPFRLFLGVSFSLFWQEGHTRFLSDVCGKFRICSKFRSIIETIQLLRKTTPLKTMCHSGKGLSHSINITSSFSSFNPSRLSPPQAKTLDQLTKLIKKAITAYLEVEAIKHKESIELVGLQLVEITTD